jgi:hypothetical protein
MVKTPYISHNTLLFISFFACQIRIQGSTFCFNIIIYFQKVLIQASKPNHIPEYSQGTY